MRLKRRAPKGQLWVHYNQIGGYWCWRISADGVTFHSGERYLTEFAAGDAADRAYAEHFSASDWPLVAARLDMRIFRTDWDYAMALATRGRRRHC